MKGILFLFILSFFVIFLSQVNEVSGLAGKQNQSLDLTHSVRVGGGIGAVNCNLTVWNPNNIVLVNFEQMTNSLNYFNYTLNENQTGIRGTYNYDVTCFSPAGLNETQSFNFFINLSGIEPSESRTQALTRTIYFFFVRKSVV